MKKKKRMNKLKIIVCSLVGIAIIASIGVYLYFPLGARVVSGIDGLESIDPNDNSPVLVNLTEEDLKNLTEEQRKELGIPDDW